MFMLVPVPVPVGGRGACVHMWRPEVTVVLPGLPFILFPETGPLSETGTPY